MTAAPTFDRLADLVDGRTFRPGDPDYPGNTPWNCAVRTRPGAVVCATSATDIAATVRYAGDRGLRVAVQATGHGAVPIGPDTVLVLTAGMTDCIVDTADRSARVGAGTRWQQVVEAAAPHGLAPLCGSAPGVGVIGYLTGAGIGPLVRTFGVSSDYVRGFTIVTGAGETLRVTPEDHPDLFWGVRGGKSMLGIVTEIEIDLLLIPQFYGGAVYFDGLDAEAVLHSWRDWCANLPDDVNTSIALQQLPTAPGVPAPLAGRSTVSVRYTALGDFAVAEQLLAPIRACAKTILDTVSVRPYGEIGAVHSDPEHPMPAFESHVLLRDLTADAADAIVRLGGPGSAQTVTEIRMLGGAMSHEGRHPSVCGHRDASFALTTVGVPAPDDPDAVARQAAELIEAVGPCSTGGQLANFGASNDPDRPARVYGDATLLRLTALAHRYDPSGVFRS